MRLTAPALKGALGAGLRHCPFAFKRRLLAPLLQQVFAATIAAGGLDFLRGRRVCLRIDDFGERLYLGFDGRRLLPQPACTADVTIGGDSGVFLLLATRRIDADTLFFQRRLTLEGDTELGLAVKNLIDAIDEEGLPRWARALLALARRRLDGTAAFTTVWK